MNEIFLICNRLYLELGGLPKVVLNKANKFTEMGYKVTILTIDLNMDYKYISKELKKRNQLLPDINFINLYNFYEDKSVNFGKRFLCIFENFFNNIKLREIGLPLRKHKNVFVKRYYASNGFCYYIELFIKNKLSFRFLIDREKKEIFKFEDEDAINKHFFLELANSCKEKPIFICEGAGPTPRISNIDKKIAYLISQLHSNPYIGKNHEFGEKMRKIGILNKIENNNLFVVLTETQRKDIIKEFGNINNIIIIPNSIPESNLIGAEKDNNKISLFTRISPEKNVLEAIDIFYKVLKEKPNAIFEIYGRASKELPSEVKELKKLKKHIKKLNMEKNVFIKGYVKDVNKAMEESLLTILTSKREGFGMVIIESMYNATPVVSYDINYGPRDIIDHGFDGYLVEKNNQDEMAKYIIELLNNPEKAKNMGKNAREKVSKKYTSEIIFPQWKELFESLL
ncbi:Glycosyltransferase Gtf1 [bioreactor metagenome]|uniref:Glycosyltransferase Gtf1 n=1 Tax=bioreactor metagenome TaxID=1076179 RepID=A0A644TXS4_9ZZZZ|nr:glycosyltransferase [Methanobrevibacter sp.]MEA4957108.1 glycosyltransferase [Methanobrevibacter sp.]